MCTVTRDRIIWDYTTDLAGPAAQAYNTIIQGAPGAPPALSPHVLPHTGDSVWDVGDWLESPRPPGNVGVSPLYVSWLRAGRISSD